MDDCIERALYLQSALNEFVEKEIDHWHVVRRRRQKALRPSIVDDRLSTDDWEVLKAYHEILQPIKKPTNILQGQIGGHFGAIWQVLPQFEVLLIHLEEQRQRHLPLQSQRSAPSPPQHSQLRANLHGCIETQQGHTQQSREARIGESRDVAHKCVGYIAAEQHFSMNINAGWQKLDEYYKRLDDNVVYVAAVVLHPQMKWRYFKTKWSDREDWLSTWKAELYRYWRHNYENKAASSSATSAGMDGDSGGKASKMLQTSGLMARAQALISSSSTSASSQIARIVRQTHRLGTG
jgi:hypothetical protein